MTKHFRSCRMVEALSLAFILFASASSFASSRNYAIEVSATVQRSPAQITLQWRSNPGDQGYLLYRKTKEATAWGPPVTIAASATSYTDRNVQTGVAYEYRISKNPLHSHFGGSGFICTGIDVPMVDARGKLVLVVEKSVSGALVSELQRLEQDLVGDGWTVLRRDVNRTDSPSNVKSVIKKEYLADPANVKAVFLFGHVPVPYSGDFHPDYHPEHRGAWPADLFYGDMDGVWTDSSVNNAGADRAQNRNVPGDGKFDQSDLPSNVELQVGRVDLFDLPGFAPKTEVDLLRQYLNKDHNFRHRVFTLPERGLINDNFGSSEGEAFAASGYRNFAPFFGPENIKEIPGHMFFSTLAKEAYLWSYACGGGSYNYCHYVGGTGDFGTTDIRSAFVMLLGSYFGDWDSSNNFLRAPLASKTYGLASMWAGRPHWFLHHMAMGETIGYSTRLTQNNGPGGLYQPQHWEARRVHVALMGDPTLRMHPVLPPSNVTVRTTSGGATIQWNPSADSSIQGYHVYRATSTKGPFTKVTGSTPVTTTSFTDSSALANSVYMVRAIKLQSSASGTYFNPSQGILAVPSAQETVFITPTLRATKDGVEIQFDAVIGKTYQLEASTDLRTWTAIQTIVALNTRSVYLDPQALLTPSRFYRIRVL